MARNRKDNIYPVGVILYCRQVFEGCSPEKACSRDARLVRPWHRAGWHVIARIIFTP